MSEEQQGSDEVEPRTDEEHQDEIAVQQLEQEPVNLRRISSFIRGFMLMLSNRFHIMELFNHQNQRPTDQLLTSMLISKHPVL